MDILSVMKQMRNFCRSMWNMVDRLTRLVINSLKKNKKYDYYNQYDHGTDDEYYDYNNPKNDYNCTKRDYSRSDDYGRYNRYTNDMSRNKSVDGFKKGYDRWNRYNQHDGRKFEYKKKVPSDINNPNKNEQEIRNETKDIKLKKTM